MVSVPWFSTELNPTISVPSNIDTPLKFILFVLSLLPFPRILPTIWLLSISALAGPVASEKSIATSFPLIYDSDFIDNHVSLFSDVFPNEPLNLIAEPDSLIIVDDVMY
ncbi:hypothetical protein NMD69_02495 [Edwardsiella tarda]|uniref:hypothetical protein n=1 Tax=Edwardsiella tarda TaxID=636 RepID=UPI00351CA9F3